MANEEQLAILKQGVKAWNAWRREHTMVRPALPNADLRSANLMRANLREANLVGADLYEAQLVEADLSGAHLYEADLSRADLSRARLDGAKLDRAHLGGANLHLARLGGATLDGTYLDRAQLVGAHLAGADLYGAKFGRANLWGINADGAMLVGADLDGADLSEADLRKANLNRANLDGAKLFRANLAGATLVEADLRGAVLVETNLAAADLTGCRVHGLSAWRLDLGGTTQKDLIITSDDEPVVTVDNLEVAQFVYLLLHNEKIRHVIDTITSKVVLILGRFTPERKAVLDALREELRRRDYLPALFDFSPSEGRDITETVSLLARMARFVVADITDARSIPHELGVIVPDLPSVPVQPLLLAGAGEYGMFEHYRRYPWVLETYVYASADELIASLGERVIAPAEAKVRELRAVSPPAG